MLGSHFDLDREIARIASKRETAADTARPERIQAYSDFDRNMRDFVRSVGRDRDPDDAERSEKRRSAVDPEAVRRTTGTLHQLR